MNQLLSLASSLLHRCQEAGKVDFKMNIASEMEMEKCAVVTKSGGALATFHKIQNQDAPAPPPHTHTPVIHYVQPEVVLVDLYSERYKTENVSAEQIISQTNH